MSCDKDRLPHYATANLALPLAFAYQMRNAVAQRYSTVDLKIVWTTIRNDLPGLYRKVQTLLQDLPPVVARPAARRPGA